MIGSTKRHRKKMRIKKRKSEYLSINSLNWKNRGGKSENRTLEPSRGGTGTKLNIASTIFIITIYIEIWAKEGEIDPPPNRSTIPKTRAIKRFESGPAIEIRSSPHLLFLTLLGFHSIGRAHPKVNPAKEVIIGMINEPNRSRCFNGFKVSLPCILGVGSPKISAI
jgi:hypothetical protein